MSNLVWGSWNAVCDGCGFEYKSFQLRKRWDGMMTCKLCWEPRHPQDLIKIPKEDTSVPWTRPEPPDVFIEVPYVASTVGVQDQTGVPAGTFEVNNGTIE